MEWGRSPPHPPILFFPFHPLRPVPLKVFQVGVDGIFELIPSGTGALIPTCTPLPSLSPRTTGFLGEGRTAHPRDDLPIRGESQAHGLQGFRHISLEGGFILVNGG